MLAELISPILLFSGLSLVELVGLIILIILLIRG